ncbi:hypothetical protein Tco_1059331 [Tanacetum coccineum]
MAEPNNYITATRKNFVSNDNEGRMVEKCIVEIQGTFLVKIRKDAFNRNIGENAYKHIDKFLKIVRLIKINGLTLGSITIWDDLVKKFIMKFHHLSDHDEEEETEEEDNPNKMDNVPAIFKIEGNMWYDELADRKLKDETLALKVSNPYLDVNHIFGRNYEASNIGDAQENQGHEEQNCNPNLGPSNCKIRRFKMMKYSFDEDEDYITIKESEYLNHSKDSLDAYRELLRLIYEGWVVTTPDE